MAILSNYMMPGCTCRRAPPTAMFTYFDVSAPVGKLENLGGTGPRRGNLPDDVRTVQRLLNQIGAAEGGQMRADGTGTLVVDGIIGPLTRGAITTFQKKQFPTKAPDTVVEPKKRTIYRMNVKAIVPQTDDDMQARGRAALAAVTPYIIKAHGAVARAQNTLELPNPLFTDQKLNGLLDYHFHMDKSSDRYRDLGTVRGVLQTMLMAVGHRPTGPTGKPAFGFISESPGPFGNKNAPYAHTFAGGYQYLQGKRKGELGAIVGITIPEEEQSVYVDQIYLTRRLLTAAQGTITYAIIHELAHFCGGVTGDIDEIDDRAYWYRQQAKYERLNTYEAMTNADSYAQFCWELMHDTRFRP